MRLGTFVLRRVPEGEAGAGRLLTLRWFVLGPIVARGGSSGRARWWGARVEGTGIDIRKR